MPYPGPFFLRIDIHDPDETSQEAYDEIYAKGDLSVINSFYHWWMDQIDMAAGGRFIDISCGAGEVVELAARAGQIAVGIDFAEQAARKSKHRVGDRAALTVGLGEALPYADACFDTVSNVGSLEHFLDPAQGVREMSRILKPGGKAYILVPNTYSILDNVWYAMRTGMISYDNQPIQRYGARQDWTVLLERNGLRVKRVLKYERIWPRSRRDWQELLRRPREILRLLATPFLPTNLAYAFIFVCEKNPPG